MNYKPIVPWMGGKRRLAKQILPIISDHKTYVEPFCGGAAIYFLKQPSAVEVINDINGELVNLYRIIKHHLEEFLRHFKWALISREEYLLKQKISPETLTDIQRAERFYYLQKMAFGGKTTGQNFGISAVSPPRLNLLRIEEDLSQAHIRLARTYIEHLSWEKCIEKYDRKTSFFYLDPPYWQTADYGERFSIDQYEHMAKLAQTIKGKMLISINDHPDIRSVFTDLEMIQVPIKYTVGCSKGEKRKVSHELIIKNY